MELLKQKIYQEGRVFPGQILKVDNFLNHQIDTELLMEIGKEFAKRFDGEKITKVLTIESSGIAIAGFVSYAIKAPLLFAKKTQTKNISAQVYTSKVMSYTHGKVYDVFVSKEYLTANDRVLVIDDFLANGKALEGLVDLVNQAGASLVGCGIVIEKAFQKGGDNLREKGIKIESLVRVLSMTDKDLVLE